jgi:hypothetical protein
MKKLAPLIALVALALPAASVASLPSHPGQTYSTFASRMVCDRANFQTAPTPVHKNLMIAVSVAGQQIPVVGGNRSNTLDSSGLGVLVRITQNARHRAPLSIRVASVRTDCVRVNVLATWR